MAGVHGLGDLEAVVMGRMWDTRQPATVREVLRDLSDRRPLAYTTVMTVLDNLHRKGLLDREMTGRAWTYRAVVSREEYTAALMRDALHSAAEKHATLAHFVAAISEDESQMLRAVLRRRPGRPS